MTEVIRPRSGTAAEFFEGLRVEGSVIGALIMRELHTRYGRRGLGYVWLILEPLLLASLVAALKLFTREQHHGIEVLPFVVLGYTTFIMFRGMWNRADSAIASNMALMYHRMVTIFDILLARGLLEAMGSICSFLILVGVCILLDMGHLPARPIHFLLGFLQLFWWSFGWSMVICGLAYENSTIEKFVHPLSYIMMPLSGAFFMVSWFPHKVHDLIQWWPMASMFEQMRYGWFETASDRYFYPGYCVAWCMVLTMIGLLSIQMVRRKIELK